MKTKIKLFTHTDLDGVGCAVLTKHVFKSFLEIEFCGYHNVNEKITNFLNTENLKNYSAVFITDISVNLETAERIDKDYADKFILLDHHKTAVWLNKYGWALVKETEIKKANGKEVATSGTSLLFSFLYENGLIIGSKYRDFVEFTRLYDTWEWFPNKLEAKQLNDLYIITGRQNFMTRFLQNPSICFSETEIKLLELEETRLNSYIRTKQNELIKYQIDKFMVGVVFAERYQSEVGNSLSDNNRHLDFIVILNPSKKQISFRTTKENVNLSEISKRYGGGGHTKSAGCFMSENSILTFLESLFKE